MSQKILIVAPRYKPFGQFYELPLGLAYISSYLKSWGVDVVFINLNEIREDMSTGILNTFLPDTGVVCTGGLSVHYPQIRALLENIKVTYPHIHTVVGGGLICSEPELMMQHLPIDIGIVGEGEEKLFEILNDPGDPSGLHYAEPIKDLDALPYPDYEGLGVRGYLDRQLCADDHYLYPFDKPRCLPIISSRSCPFNCSFCFHPTGRVYRQRSLDNFFGEVEYLVATYGINMLAVMDELISQDPARLEEFCRRMTPFKLNWMAQMRADSVTRDTIKLLKSSGCHRISYGVESADNKVLESMGKHTTIDVIEQALEWTYEAGVGIQGNFIFGDRAETLESAQKTLNWWLQHRHLMLNLTYLIPYPGSELYKYARSIGSIPDALEYIRSGCPSAQLCGQIGNISSIVEMVRPSGILLAKVLLREKTGVDPWGRGDLWHFRVICPHCEHVNDYRNLYFNSTGFRIGCRNCNQRFDIPKEEPCTSQPG